MHNFYSDFTGYEGKGGSFEGWGLENIKDLNCSSQAVLFPKIELNRLEHENINVKQNNNPDANESYSKLRNIIMFDHTKVTICDDSATISYGFEQEGLFLLNTIESNGNWSLHVIMSWVGGYQWSKGLTNFVTSYLYINDFIMKEGIRGGMVGGRNRGGKNVYMLMSHYYQIN